MRKLSLLLPLLLAAQAQGQEIDVGWLKKPNALLAEFLLSSSSGCIATGAALGTKGQTVTQSRSGNAAISAGTICTANQMRFGTTPAGLWIEPATTQYVTSPTSPGTETKSLAIGNGYVALVDPADTGSYAITNGTAVVNSTNCTPRTGLVCGLPCTVNATQMCSWNVATAGNVTWTKTGTVGFFNIQQSVVRALYGIRAPTSRVYDGSRAADFITIANPLAGKASGCYSLSGVSLFPWDDGWTPRSAYLWAFNTSGAANSGYLYIGTNDLNLVEYDATPAARTTTYSLLHWPAGSVHDVTACIGATPSLWIDGWQVPTTSSGTGTGVATVPAGNLVIGSAANGGYSLDGAIQGVKGCAKPDSKCVPSLRRQAYGICSLGDSIGAGFGVTNAYSIVLANLLGASQWRTGNDAVSGYYTSQIVTKWRTVTQQRSCGTLVVEGGVNDIRNDTDGADGATTIANLTTVYDEARAQGIRVIPTTILPWRTGDSWTEERDRRRKLINAATLAYCQAHGITCVDSATAEDDGTSALTHPNGTDHLHPYQTAHDEIGAMARQAMPGGATCSDGAVTVAAPCICGSLVAGAGYCCGGTWSATACP